MSHHEIGYTESEVSRMLGVSEAVVGRFMTGQTMGVDPDTGEGLVYPQDVDSLRWWVASGARPDDMDGFIQD